MFNKQEILNDFKALLTGINTFSEGEDRVNSALYPSVGIDVTLMSPSFLADTGVNSGYYAADVMLDCVSYRKDDLDRSIVNQLAFDVMLIVNQDDILERLNQVSTFYTYIGFNPGDSFPDDEDSFRHEVLQFKIHTANKNIN